MIQCDIGFCAEPVVAHLRAFDNPDERGYCAEHAELAKANIEAGAGDG